MILRDYQHDGADRVRHAFKKHSRVMYQLPTGGGKTVLFCYIAHNATAKGNRVAVLVHRRELIKQTCKKLAEWDVDHGVIAAGFTPDRAAQVQVCSIQSLLRRELPSDVKLAIVDEAHHATANTWQSVLEALSGARILGVSATPARMTGAGLGEYFEHMVCGPQISWLIERGYLVQPVVYGAKLVDTSGLHVQAGDYNKKEVNSLVNDKAVVGNAVEHYARHFDGKPCIVFCASVEHAESVAEAYRAAGYRAASVDGKMEQEVRDRRINGLGDGSIQVLTSCQLIDEGLDIPVVAGIQDLTPTKSLPRYLQRVGRALRPYEGKTEAIVLDHVGNYTRHGLPDMDRTWTLAKGVKTEREVEVVHCPQCKAVLVAQHVCPHCGFEFELPDPAEAQMIEEVEGILQRITPEDVDALWERAKQQGTMKSYHEWGQAKARLEGKPYKAGTGFFAFKRARRNFRKPAA